MSITPYVLFSNGVCAEAMTRYQEVLGGELEVMRAGDMPPGEENSMPGLTPDSVIHSSLSVDGALLYTSDDPTGDGGPMVGMQLAYTAADVEASQRVFGELAESTLR